MCELFAMSSRFPTTVSFSLERLARRGGIEAPHRDGWGVAYYEQRDTFLLREPRAAAESELAGYIEHNGPPSQLVISHIRQATIGEVALRNTQPFVRELGGAAHIFAHNGDLEGIEKLQNSSNGSFKTIGDTDSEQAFCILLSRLQTLWMNGNNKVPSLEKRLAIISAFAKELRELGPANFLYADSDALFVHPHQRTQEDGEMKPPGIHMLVRLCHEAPLDLSDSGITLTSLPQETVLLASVPLTDEPWQALPSGEVIVVRNGSVSDVELPGC